MSLVLSLQLSAVRKRPLGTSLRGPYWFYWPALLQRERRDARCYGTAPSLPPASSVNSDRPLIPSPR